MAERNLQVEICGVKFKNPVIAASGTFGFGREYAHFYDIGLLGGVSTKALTIAPRRGNPMPRVAETPSGMLNAIGLQNPGVETYLAEHAQWLKSTGTTVIANIAGATVEDYVAVAERLNGAPVDMLELNISCPNVKQGGVAFGTDPKQVEHIVREVKRAAGQPLMVKLSPNVTDITETALAAQQAGADALSLINTLTGMEIDVHRRRPLLANVTGGLSGPAVRPVALRMVYQVCRKVQIPVVGMGGIMTGEDAVAFMLCGARAVMVGTANVSNPNACPEIIKGIEEYMIRHDIWDVNELVDALMV